MFKKYKYDLAFSFVWEDIEPVNRLVAEFKKEPRVRYYIYTEHEAENLGQHILKITRNVYPHSRYVLMVTSKDFISGFWSRVEKIFLLAYINKHIGRIIQIKLDSTFVDGVSSDLVHIRWQDDPERIADVLIRKILKQKAREKKIRVIAISVLSLMILLLTGLYFFVYLPIIRPGSHPLRQLNPVEIKDAANPFPAAINTTAQSFFLNETEVTIAEYRKYCDYTHQSMPPQPWPALCNNPVVNITWREAMSFCQWVEGRLPSEAEWEYAASANLQTKYAGGENAGKVAVYDRKHLRPVGTKLPNAFGIFDMSGNVAEWTSTATSVSDSSKIVKGGSYLDSIVRLNISARDTQQINTRRVYIGFRVAWDHKPSKQKTSI